jgi:acyl-coenzyme A synthetase/AMP-(fatty) acid ligase
MLRNLDKKCRSRIPSLNTVSLVGKKAEELALISELQEHVKSTTAPYKYPRKIDLVDSLPKVKVSASKIVYYISIQ